MLSQDRKKWHSLPNARVEPSSVYLECRYIRATQCMPPITYAVFFSLKNDTYICAHVDGQFSWLKNELCAHKYVRTGMCDKKRQRSMPNLHMEQGSLCLDVDLNVPSYRCLQVRMCTQNQFSSLVYEKTLSNVASYIVIERMIHTNIDTSVR
jgi:hypothetical protein